MKKNPFSKFYNIKLVPFQEGIPHHQRLLIKDLLTDGIMEHPGDPGQEKVREYAASRATLIIARVDSQPDKLNDGTVDHGRFERLDDIVDETSDPFIEEPGVRIETGPNGRDTGIPKEHPVPCSE